MYVLLNSKRKVRKKTIAIVKVLIHNIKFSRTERFELQHKHVFKVKRIKLHRISN